MSASEKWKMEKEKFSTMPLEEKRKLYKDNKYVEVTAVPTWTAYYQKAKDRLQECLNSSQQTAGKYPVKPDLNNKVSIWVGNITHLEIDSIVNAANKTLMGGGGVDGAIHSAAGPSLKGECATLNGCDTGEAKITGGYLLPAKHVIHTVGPVGEKPEKLKSCYEKSLKLLTENKLRTVAFPCISTGIYGYPNEPAAHVAIGTARAYLEAHLDSVDRVIFCLFLQKDVEIYETLMQLYFPVEN